MSVQEVTHPHRENGAKIRRARKLVPSPKDPARHISHQDLAPKVGCTPRHLIRLEKGEQLPSGQLRDRIVEVTGTEERIESDDDEEGEYLPWQILYPTADISTVLMLRALAKKKLRRAIEIERALAK